MIDGFTRKLIVVVIFFVAAFLLLNVYVGEILKYSGLQFPDSPSRNNFLLEISLICAIPAMYGLKNAISKRKEVILLKNLVPEIIGLIFFFILGVFTLQSSQTFLTILGVTFLLFFLAIVYFTNRNNSEKLKLLDFGSIVFISHLWFYLVTIPINLMFPVYEFFYKIPSPGKIDFLINISNIVLLGILGGTAILLYIKDK